MCAHIYTYMHTQTQELQFVQNPVIHHNNQIWWPDIEFQKESNGIFKSIMTHDIKCVGPFTSSSP